MIKVENLSKTFISKENNVEALKDVSFEIGKGEIYGIIGLSGAGKSTLIRCINLLEKPTSGNVIVDGDNMLSLSEKELRLKRRKIGMIFQNFNLLMQRTVLSNVAFALRMLGISKQEANEKALNYLDIVGLKDKADSYPSQLSGGQKQRVAIARALALNPEIILCDEATSALDPENTQAILNLIKRINKEYGITVIVITHEMSVIQEICDRCAVLEYGQLQEEDTVEELFKHPKTDAARRLIFNSNFRTKNIEGGRLIRIAFEESNTQDPVIANLVLQFKCPVNILESNITSIGGQSRGQMIIQLPDDEKLVKEIIAYLQNKDSLVVEEITNYGK